jgi:flagellar motility protein MotE (MotC chaperone)
MSRAPRKPRARVLPALILLFLAAAGLRLANGVTAALAQDPAPPDPVPAAHAPSVPPPAPGPAIAATADLAVEIRRRELAVAEREAALEERAGLVAAAQLRLEAQIATLEETEQTLAATMALADRAAEDDIARLVTVFEAMDPEESAAVFAEMAPDFAAGFLGRLRPETAAAVLSNLEPRLAYGLSALIAGRNALVPRD